MSVRIQYTGNLLKEIFKKSKDPLPPITWEDIQKKNLTSDVMGVYKDLGGKLAKPEVLFPAFDLEFENLAIFMDEERNFNRYRAITLQSPLYSKLSNFSLEKYRSFCRTFEQECLKSASFGHHWSNSFSEKDFGRSGEKGDLYKDGASAWKYKAFQDFLTDLMPLVFDIPVIRFSIYDNLLINSKMYRVNEIIISSRQDLKIALAKNFERRILSLKKD